MQATRKQITIAALMLGLLMLGVAPATIAAEDAPALLPIEPMPRIQISDGVTIPHASPERFGFIQKIHAHCFVISDMCRGFSSDVIFRSSAGGPATATQELMVLLPFSIWQLAMGYHMYRLEKPLEG